MIVELAHELLPYALALYGFDGLVRVRPGEAALCSRAGGRFRWRAMGWHLDGLLPTAEVFVVSAPEAHVAGVPDTRVAAERDVAAIRERRAIQRRHSPRLALASTLLFAITFGALPITLYRDQAVPLAAETALAAAGVSWAVILVMAARALRSVGASSAQVASALAPALFFPPAAAHVLSFLWRDSFRAWPPLAVASVLLREDDFRRRARHEMRRLEEAERASATAALEADRRAALLGLLSAIGIGASEVAAADPPKDAQAAVFCPLCDTEYRSGFDTCTDCRVPLRPFAVSPGPSGSPAPR